MKLISETISDPKPVATKMSWSYGMTPNTCPDSTDRKKRHLGDVTTRRIMTRIYSNGKSVSYIDHVKCDFCPFEWDQEWMSAF